MEYELYQVVPGDTLGEIAKRNDTDVETLAGVNGIDDPNKIYIGQQLKIPVDLYPDDENFYNEQWICFVDPLGKPICNMKTRVVTASGEYCFTTDERGFIPPVRTRSQDDKPKVFVAKIQGGEKQVAVLTAPPGVHQQTIRSPKQKVTIPFRRHEGTPDHDPARPVKLDPGQVQHNRDQEGHPVANVGVECPNKDNLRLGPNFKYRNSILEAARRGGFTTQAVAALINLEAGRKSTTITKTFKLKGEKITKTEKIATLEWDPDSANPRSSAVGLTQFIKGTWMSEVRRSGTFINEKALTTGLIHKNPHGGFIIHDEEAVLNLRKDPECAIMEAVDYGNLNLSLLRSSGFNFASINSYEKAKIFYLCHHLGEGDTILARNNSGRRRHEACEKQID